MRSLVAAAWLLLSIGMTGCAAHRGLPQCHGPFTPVNAAVEDVHRG